MARRGTTKVKAEKHPCGCFIEVNDDNRVKVNICEQHQAETRRLKVREGDTLEWERIIHEGKIAIRLKKAEK